MIKYKMILSISMLVLSISCSRNKTEQQPIRIVSLQWQNMYCQELHCEEAYAVENMDITDSLKVDSLSKFVQRNFSSANKKHRIYVINFFKYDKSGKSGVNEKTNFDYPEWNYGTALIAEYVWADGKFYHAIFYNGETEVYKIEHIEGL